MTDRGENDGSVSADGPRLLHTVMRFGGGHIRRLWKEVFMKLSQKPTTRGGAKQQHIILTEKCLTMSVITRHFNTHKYIRNTFSLIFTTGLSVYMVTSDILRTGLSYHEDLKLQHPTSAVIFTTRPIMAVRITQADIWHRIQIPHSTVREAASLSDTLNILNDARK